MFQSFAVFSRTARLIPIALVCLRSTDTAQLTSIALVAIQNTVENRDVNRAAQLALPLLSFFCSVLRSGVKRLPRSGGVPRKVYFYFQILS